MAPEWEAALGMELGMGSHYHHAPPSAAASPMNHHHHHHHSAYTHSQPPHQYHFYGGAAGGDGTADPMRVDEMLDLSSHLGAHDFFSGANNGGAGQGGDNAPAPPAAAAASSSDHQHHHPSSFNLSFADEFYLPVPTEEAAELEWLSNFVDDSYPDIPNYPPAVQAAMAAAARNGGVVVKQENSASAAAPGRGARSKRSRAASAAAAAWHALAPRQPSPSSSSSSSDSKPARSGGGGGVKKSGLVVGAAELGGGGDQNGEVRRCTHCASEKTPQWRTGPLGPKTLCNACGVRYKSGRLVPEYRPAASPTFVLTQHSNSHRKVMELRRQNELVHLRGGVSGGVVSASSGSGGAAEHMFRDYGVC
ncbi:unnamed protein product [Triticum turgidum subsp. durum]|nr:unnamed protein product [Triticum turgidum subsp. durum]